MTDRSRNGSLNNATPAPTPDGSMRGCHVQSPANVAGAASLDGAALGVSSIAPRISVDHPTPLVMFQKDSRLSGAGQLS
jgi:hypothetical protein